jgi:hypothetical protein
VGWSLMRLVENRRIDAGTWRLYSMMLFKTVIAM